MGRIRSKNASPRVKGIRQSGQKINSAARELVARRRSVKKFFPQSGLKRDRIHNVLNSSTSSLKDSPNSHGMYKRRNRRSGRYFQFQQNNPTTIHTISNSQEDCIILPDKPPEVISLLDTDDETENNNKRKLPLQQQNEQSPKRKHARLSGNSPQAGPSEAAKIRYPQTDAFTPFSTDTKNDAFFIDTKSEDTPILQIPLYKSTNDSIICLDDTLPTLPSSSSTLPKYESILNDSIVVIADDSQVEEKKLNETLEEGEIPPDDSFIPLESEKKAPKKEQKRLVIIDGNNVAMQHGNNKIFSVQGIEIAIKHFEDLGHVVKAIIPQFRMKLHKSTSQVLLEKLQNEGKVLLTPCKNLPGNISASYDDRFILEVAEKCDGAIISNDNYKDLLNEKPVWHKIITSRVVGFMFCGDNFFVPSDPYGKRGPKLKSILNKPVEK